MHSLKKWRHLAPATSLALVFVSICGCSDDEKRGPRNGLAQYDSDVVTTWFGLSLDITRDESLTPPVAARAFAYQSVALYEAVVPGLETHQSLAGPLIGISSTPQPLSGASYHWPTVANAALATVARQLYSEASTANKEAINDLEASFEEQFESVAGSAVFSRSVAHGEAVGNAIYDWAFADGYHEKHDCDYTVPQGQGLWEPTPPANLPPLEPCWGEIRDFILPEPSICQPAGPPPFDDLNRESPFYIEMLDVYNTKAALTDEQRNIAVFWADGAGTMTPSGHWIAILNQLTEESEWTLDVTCEAYAKLGLAMGEAFNSCWRAKYRHNFIRPVTCIRNSLDPAWNSFIVTPPFPEYPSGHSTQSAAAAQVLTDLFGHMEFVDHTHDGDATGLAARPFSSFFDAADEAAISRLYGGIHFRSAIDDGIVQGKCIGAKVSALAFLK